MARRKAGREVVYVERGGDASAKWLFWGAVLGAGLALLYAPRTGEETRRVLQRKLWKLRAVTEEKLDELAQQFSSGREALQDLTDDDDDDGEEFDELAEAPPLRARAGTGRETGASAREELERRLAESRARRRAAGDEEPLA
jgi:gas vesicle protein